VELWREDYRHFEEDPAWLIERLRPLKALVGAGEFGEWEALADARQMPLLFERLMERHYDPAYGRSIAKHYPDRAAAQQLSLPALDAATLAAVATKLIAEHPAVDVSAVAARHAPGDPSDGDMRALPSPL
jgi:tRNA 2-selenouridine synthase